MATWNFKEDFEKARKDIELLLDDSKVSESQAKEVICRYRASIEQNHIAWSSTTLLNSPYPEVRYTSEKNLEGLLFYDIATYQY